MDAPTVLVVEASESLRLLVSAWLSSSGLRVLSFGDTEVALFVSAGVDVRVVVLGPACGSEECFTTTAAFMKSLRVVNPEVTFVSLQSRASRECAAFADPSHIVVSLESPGRAETLASAVQILLSSAEGVGQSASTASDIASASVARRIWAN